MKFLHQGFQKLSSDRQTQPKLYCITKNVPGLTCCDFAKT